MNGKIWSESGVFSDLEHNPLFNCPLAFLPELTAFVFISFSGGGLLFFNDFHSGVKAKPGEASLAHRGVLFLDELPEFTPQVLDSLRQPLEEGEISVARVNAHVKYPARFQLIAAMNPCRCGTGGANGISCPRGERCAVDYQARVSGPFMDRIDIQIDVPAVTPADLALPPSVEGTAEIAARVARAREVQLLRNGGVTNAELRTDQLDHVAQPDSEGRKLLTQAAETLGLTARGYHRVLRVARTLADLAGSEHIHRLHIAESLSHRRARKGLNSGGGNAKRGQYETKSGDANPRYGTF